MKAPEVGSNGVVNKETDSPDTDPEDESNYLLESRSLINSVDQDAPRDRFQVVYCTFFLFGICSVLPWNMFITGQQYFDYKFANTSMNGTDLRPTFESYFSVAAMVPNIIAQVLNLMVLQHRISLRVRVILPLIGMFLLFTLTTVLTRIDTREWQLLFFGITIASFIVISALAAIYQGSIFGVAGTLPRRYMQAIMSGQGMGGILPSLLSISTVAGTSNPADSGFIYFLCAMVCILVTIVAFLSLTKIKFSAYYLSRQVALTRTETLEDSKNQFKPHKHKPPFLDIFCKIKVPAIMILLIFAVTLGLFPGTLATIKAINTSNWIWANNYFSLVSCFLVFNTMDFVGRSLAVIQWPKAKHMTLISALVLLRLGFFPLFAFCNVQDNPPYLLFNNDAYFIVFNVLFAFSNGYLSSLLMIYGPKLVEAKHSETAGVMMALFFGAGLALGSIISVPFLEIF